jgi:hypothetical protein
MTLCPGSSGQPLWNYPMARVYAVAVFATTHRLSHGPSGFEPRFPD